MKKTKIFTILLIVALLCLTIISGCTGEEKKQTYFSLDDLKGSDMTFSLWMGCGYEDYVEEVFPDAKMIFGEYVPDLALNVRQKKADAMVLGESFFNFYHEELEDMVVLDGDIGTIDGGLIFSKGDTGSALRQSYNFWLAEAFENGTIQELTDKWLSIDHLNQEIDLTGLDTAWQHIRVGVAMDEPPYTFQKEDQLVGYDVDMIIRFCKDYEYYPDFSGSEYNALINAVETDKFDVIGAGFEITEERTKSISYGDPSRMDRVIVAVGGEAKDVSFIESIRKSFYRTFIEEDRYMKFLNGIGVTIVMTLCSVILGTILGFGFYFLNRDGGSGAQKAIEVFSVLAHRIPTVVFLMVLYYVIFGKINIDAAIVSTIFFIFTFGVFIFESLDLAVNSVGKGQIEAAFTLGLSRNETFFKILLPQGIDIFISSFKDNVVTILLETAVVGYISVVDLTRVGDIIRNNTYEAFFPLIAVAVFYFLISSLIIKLIEIVEKKCDPKRRSKASIFKSLTGQDYQEVSEKKHESMHEA